VDRRDRAEEVLQDAFTHISNKPAGYDSRFRKQPQENPMKRYSGISIGLAASLVLLAPAATGQVFKCKDADENVTYTDVPCLRSEASLDVDTSPNLADLSSIRKETARLQSSEATAAPQGQTQTSSPEPPPPAPATVEQPRSGY
jgi:hypothetical protein